MSNSIYHNHHITPQHQLKHKSKEFINHPSNIARVTSKQHLALHKRQVMLTGTQGDEWAYNMMLNCYRDGHTNLGRNHTEETKQKMRKSHVGKVLSEETKRKISDGCKGMSRNPFTDEIRLKMGKSQKGRKHSEATKKKMRESRRKYGNEPEEFERSTKAD